MPNWVFNSVAISGDKPELDKLQAQLNKPFVKHFPDHKWNSETRSYDIVANTQVYSNPVFAFWNVIAPTNLEAYYGESYKSDKENLLESIQDGFDNGGDWYNWNVRNWGTKWDVAVRDSEEYSDTRIEETDDENTLLYYFQTAWSPVPEIFEILTQQYPTLTFQYEYEEEQGWGGSATWVNGELTEQTEYDIPNSHADYEALNHRECNCQFDDEPAVWFADCPVDTEKYELVDGEWREKESV